MSLEHGMDVKTLSAIIGHVSAKTTLNIYTHITNEMQENAAASIDRGIAKAEISRQKAEAASEAQRFEPYTPPRRRPGTGYIKQLKEDLWEGRYSPVWPDGRVPSLPQILLELLDVARAGSAARRCVRFKPLRL